MAENPVPETLETIAAKIDALSRSNDERFASIETRIDALSTSIDERFAKVDAQFAETRTQLGVKIEAVETKVVQVYDEVIAMREGARRNVTEHEAFTRRLDNHDIRIPALERPRRRKS
jgi:hypothetical protein